MERINIKQYKAMMTEDKGNKYNARKTRVDGITFDSRKEAHYYCDLKRLQKAGQVVGFDMQVEFVLQEGFYYHKKYFRPIKYVADFVVRYASGKTEVVDVKGFRPRVYEIKKKMLLKQHPEIDFREV